MIDLSSTRKDEETLSIKGEYARLLVEDHTVGVEFLVVDTNGQLDW